MLNICPNPLCGYKNRKAFTLVEILVVLVIISIMTGILLTVVDPIRQRQRAQDGTTVATVNKIVSAAEAYFSVYGTYPNCLDLITNEIRNATSPTDCSAGTPNQGAFAVNSVVLPDLCDATGYAAGTVECKFRYESNGSAACLGVKMFLDGDLDNDGDSGSYLLWSSANGSISDEASGSCNVVP